MRKYLNLLLERSLPSLFVFLLTGAVSTYAGDSKSNQQILIVHSSYADYPWTASMHRGIQGEFENYPRAKDFWVEYIDTKRNLDLNYFEKLHEFFNVKYQAKKIDLIIAVDNEAYDFILKDREQLFSGVPIVFAGYIGFESTTLNDKPLTTGVVQESDFEATIEIALQLHPNTKKVVFMLPDAWPERVAWVKHLPELYAGRVDVINVTANTLEGIDHELVALGPDIVVIPLNSFQLETGRYLSFERFIEHIASVGDFPVYGLWDIALGHGIVGGKLVSGESQGREAAKLAIKILQGSPVNEVEVLKTSPNQFMFDWSQLQRFNIKLSELPAKSVVINRPESFYDKYTLLVWAASIILLLLLTLVALLVRNIANRREMVFALQESQQQQSDLLNNASSVIYMKDLDGRYIFINKVFQTIFNISNEEVKGKTDFEIFPDEIAAAFRANDLKAIKAGVGIEIEEKATQDDGDHHYISVKFPLKKTSGEVYAVCGISTDITERKRLEEQVLRSQKMDAVGQLTGGIAHDFNNILTGLFGNISMAKVGLPENHQSHKYLEESEASMKRATHLSTQLLTFAKGGTPVKQDVSIRELIEETAKFDLSGSNVMPVFESEDDLWMVEADKGQMQQVFSNLVINANQAMPSGGHLTITLENIRITADMPISVSAGNYVRISVQDDGMGIPQDQIESIFDPYFSTKETGNGLGLATTYSIINKHGGNIRVRSEIDLGTTFVILLPAAEFVSAAEVIKPTARLTEKKNAKILIMDDDPTILQLATEMLEMFGHSVESANDGRLAMQKYKQAMDNSEPYDVVIMDLTIPGGIGGKEAIVDLLQLDPKIKCIVSSGYADSPVMANYTDYGFFGVITKPYSIKRLKEEVRRVLDE